MNDYPFALGQKYGQPLGGVLPIQDHYFVLFDGQRYARHGHSTGSIGVVVFLTVEKAETFCRTVGVGLPSFKPTRVSAETFHRLYKEAGAFCVAEGLTVKDCSRVTIKDLMDIDDCE